METLTMPDFNQHVPAAGSHVLITQLPDDSESLHTTYTNTNTVSSDAAHHVSPIPEEPEEDAMSGRFSRKTNQSNESKERDEDNNRTSVGGHQSRPAISRSSRAVSDVGFVDCERRESEYGGEGGGTSGVGTDEEDDESYPDSMSMDNASDTFSVTFDPPELKDEDFDTDLEVDDDKWLHPDKYDHDTTGLTKYLTACEELEVTPVRYFMKHMLEMSMKLGHHGLGPAAMQAMSVPLECNTTIEHLDLEGNCIGEQGVEPLCRVLKENVYIVELNLAENQLGTDGALHVVQLLLENRNIEWLDLTGNRITDHAAESLSAMLRKNSTLRQLKLRHNQLGDEAAQWLKDALVDNESLEMLDVSWNHFMTRGCVMLAESIKENVGLKEVNLTMNGFGLDGAIALGEAIKVNRTLVRLDASFCRLPLEGAESLASGLQLNESLQHLDIGYNSLGHDGCMELLKGLEKSECSNLTLLDLGNSKVTVQFKELQEKLEAERPLQVHHGGFLPDTKAKERRLLDRITSAFKRDPMTKLKEWVEQAGYRLIDLLRHFDRDNSMTISREEFVNGIKSTGIDITEEQIDILLDRLDTDGDGEIDFRPWFTEGELVQGDNDHRSLKRAIRRLEEEQLTQEDEGTETS